jgi:hypothetical protein
MGGERGAIRPDDRIILDLCSGTGAWSQPYVEAGYDVRRMELKVGQDVRLMERLPTRVHGILAAPPCTYFCRMRMCRGRPTDEQFREGLSVVDACLRIVMVHRPAWWALENPQGYLKRWLGEPVLKFHPTDYGDPWTKNTWMWGEFAKPVPLALSVLADPLIHRKAGRRGVARIDAENAVTPSAFARAFFEVNP